MKIDGPMKPTDDDITAFAEIIATAMASTLGSKIAAFAAMPPTPTPTIDIKAIEWGNVLGPDELVHHEVRLKGWAVPNMPLCQLWIDSSTWTRAAAPVTCLRCLAL